MKKIDAYEQVINRTSDGAGLNKYVFNAYRETQDLDNEYLNFDYLDDDPDRIHEIVNELRRFDIGLFTISAPTTAMLRILAALQKEKTYMIGICEVRVNYNYFTKEFETAPAIKIAVHELEDEA